MPEDPTATAAGLTPEERRAADEWGEIGATLATAATKVEPEPTTVTYYRASCTCGWSLLYASRDSADASCRAHAVRSCPLVDRRPRSAV